MGWSWTSTRWRADCPSAAHCTYSRQVLRTTTVPAILAGDTAHRRCRHTGGGICRMVRVLHCPSDAYQGPGTSVCGAARGSQPDVLDTPLTTAYAPPETQPVLRTAIAPPVWRGGSSSHK